MSAPPFTKANRPAALLAVDPEGAAQIGVEEIGAGEVGAGEVGIAQRRAEEMRAAQIGMLQ